MQLLELNDSKEAVYGALDAWVAWEQNFPIASLKTILISLEKDQQWHRVVQVIKWMLSKGQGMTMGTYGQLIRALDMDHRVEEAQKFWEINSPKYDCLFFNLFNILYETQKRGQEKPGIVMGLINRAQSEQRKKRERGGLSWFRP